jgi:hypothetical protein
LGDELVVAVNPTPAARIRWRQSGRRSLRLSSLGVKNRDWLKPAEENFAVSVRGQTIELATPDGTTKDTSS